MRVLQGSGEDDGLHAVAHDEKLHLAFFHSYHDSSHRPSILTDVPNHGALLLNIECLSEVGSRMDRPEILDQALLHPTPWFRRRSQKSGLRMTSPEYLGGSVAGCRPAPPP